MCAIETQMVVAHNATVVPMCALRVLTWLAVHLDDLAQPFPKEWELVHVEEDATSRTGGRRQQQRGRLRRAAGSQVGAACSPLAHLALEPFALEAQVLL